jgi:uncharacterized protein (DUF433 family)
MRTLETILSVPLVVTKSGPIRIKDSRVSLDSIVYQFNHGATPEQIAQSFPAVPLADIYAVVAFYLRNRAAVDEYIEQQEVEGDRVQQRIESDPRQQVAAGELRERIMKRWAERQHVATSSASD